MTYRALPCSFVRFQPQSCWLFACLLLAGWGCLVADAPRATAQNVFRSMVPDLTGGFIEPPRAVRQQLEEAEEAIGEQRYSEAVLGLGKLLQRSADGAQDDDIAGQDFFLDSGGEDLDAIAIESLLRRAEDLLGDLPDEGLDIYELNYGPAAKQDLDKATASRDWVALKDIVRRYFHTSAGYQAAYLWGYHELQTGRPLAASMLFKRLAGQRRAAKQMGGQLDLALALSLKLAEREESQVQAALRSVEGPAPQRAERYRLSDSEIPAAGEGEELDWLKEHFAELKRASPPPPRDYPVAGGDASRSLSEGGQHPLSDLRWKLEATAGETETQQLQKTAQSLASQGDLPPPTWLPLRVGNQLLMRTTRRVMGVDFETGKRVWEYPWGSLAGGEAEPMPFESEVSTDSLLLSQRVWFDLPYGRLSSDGHRVFFLQDLAEVQANRRFTPFGVRAIQQGINERKNTGANTLVALDLKKEGSLLWTAGVGEQTPTIFTDAFFLGPPLPIEGRLYVIAELSGDLCLLCLDPATGTQLWRQQLLAIETGNIETDIVRRISGAMPAYQDGVLVCPTGAGAIVAVDLASRSLLWGAKYRRSAELNSMNSGRSGVDPARLMQRWLDSTPVIHDGAVYVTPIESDRLFGFDLLTGEPLFPEIVRSGMRYLAGVRDDQLILVGSREVHAYDKRSGRRRWTAAVNDAGQNAQVCGTGVFGGNLFFVPLSDRQVVAIDLANGDVVSRQNMDFDLGNLVQAGGQLISQNATEVAVAFGQQWLRPTVETRLADNPQDTWAIKRKAQLLIEDGKRDEALQWLPKALEIDSADEEARALYVSAMLGALREDFASHTDLLPTLERLVQFPERQAELLSLMARGSVREEEPVAAVEHLIALSALLADESHWAERMHSLQRSDLDAQPSLDNWIAGQVQQALSQADESQREAINAAVAVHLQAFEAQATGTLQRLTQHFSATVGADAARTRLIERLIKEEALLRAERLAQQAMQDVQFSAAGNADQRTAPFRLLLAQVYQAAGFTSDARLQAQQLSDADRDSFDEADRETLELLQEDSAAPTDNAWPDYVVTSWNASQNQRSARGVPNPDVLEILSRSGAHLRGWQVISEEGRTVSLRDPNGRVTSVPMAVSNAKDEGTRSAALDGGVMIALMPSELVAIDMFRATQGSRDADLWRLPWRSELGGRMARARSTATPFGDNHKSYDVVDPLRRSPPSEFRLGPISGNQLYLLNAGQLQAIDVLQGELRWSNQAVPPRGYVVSDGQRVAVASAQTDDGRVDIFDCVDGRKLLTQPWPEEEMIWFAAGKHLLTYQVAEGNVPTHVSLRDVFSDAVVLTQELAAPETAGVTAKGNIVEGRWLTLLQPSGEVLVWDLIEGRQVGTHQLDPIDKLNGLQTVVRGDTLILLPETSVRPERKPNTIPNIAQSRVHFRVDGPVLCMHLQSGEVVWQTELEDSPWGCTIGQATGSPLLIFSRALSIHSPTASTRRKQELSMLALDVKTGEQVARRNGLPLPSFNSDIVTHLNVDPQQHVVAAMVGASFMQFAFTNQEPPPQPVQEEASPEADEEEDEAKPFDLFR
ncbi:outer membrane protein assembly factor BamB family protein [Roseimaritima ulvae]|uniref:Outer membrane biogenesis protein BamB n=1 Tax=Roseimaritima ulvae TaxID=980254 RepID=A0A5B9R055_9BACT|nr:PQQ-binding-like beta-propeller repeat protein [Roseimaritima ulvae]QEG43639.1 outer membrane biogenesis protein BamB [Roseimaritima ulvae]